MSRIYVEALEVVKYEPTGKLSPLGEPILKVEYKGGTSEEMTRMRFKTVQSSKPSDATIAREQLLKAVSEKYYAIAIEYGVRFSEMDALINSFVKLANDSQSKANCILWGIEFEKDRNLLMVNNVLMDKYGPKSGEKKDGGDGTAS